MCIRDRARFELIERYYSMRDRVASRIAIDGEVEDEELLKEFLENKKQKNCLLYTSRCV